MVKFKSLKDFAPRPAIIVAGLVTIVTFISTYIGKQTVIIASVCAAVAVVLITLKRFKQFAVALLILIISVNLCVTYNRLNNVRNLSGKEIKADFVVTSDSVFSDNKTYLDIKSLKNDILPEGVNLSPVLYGREKLFAGDIISANVKLSDIAPSKRKVNYSEGVYVYSYIKDYSLKGETNGFYKTLGKSRRYIKSSYLSNSPGDSGALLLAITMGDKSHLSGSLNSAIRNIGISHMVAVSGFHLAIVLGGLFAVFNRFIKNRFLRFALSLLAVLFIAGVCGFPKSILRAGSMFVISAAAPLFDRESDSLSSLALSIATVFLISPFAIFSIGFNLSVISTFALIYISPVFINILKDILGIKSIIINAFTEIVINSFFAAFWTMPAVIKVFGRVSVVSLFANLFLNYLVTFALVFGTLAIVVSPIEFAAGILFNIAAFFSKAMIFIIKGFSEIPIVSVNMGKTAYIISILIITVITAFVFYYNKRIIKGGKIYEAGF